MTTVSRTPVPPAHPLRRGGNRRVRVLGVTTGVVLSIVVAVVAWLAPWPGEKSGTSIAPAVPASWRRPAVSPAGLAGSSGIKITQVALTGEGGLLDLRYKVVDPGKALALHDEKNPPALVDETSGLIINQLFMDHSHTGPFKTGVTYYLVFSNPGNWVHRGSKVTVLLGNAQVEHVVVR